MAASTRRSTRFWVFLPLLATAGALVLDHAAPARGSDVRSRAEGQAPAWQAPMNPFDPAPTMRLPTTAGELVLGGGSGAGESYIFIGHSNLSATSEAIWQGDVAELVAPSAPRDAHYVFLSYGETAADVQSDIAGMSARAEQALAALSSEADRAHWRDHLHYVAENPLKLDDPVADVLSAWGSVVADVHAEWQGDTGQTTAVDTKAPTDTGWARSLAETGPITAPVALYGNLACGADEPVQPLDGRIALIERGTCTFSEKTANAAKRGAVAVLIYTDDRPAIRMGGSCDPCPDVPVAMIDRQPGLDMRMQLEAANLVTATMAPIQVGADVLAVDHQSRLRELGSIPFPFNNSLDKPLDNFYLVTKEAQYLHYEHVRDEKVRAEVASGRARSVPLIQGRWVSDPNWAGVREYAEVDLPDAATIATFDSAELDLRLSCPDHRRGNCPAWDYIVDLWLCNPYLPERCDTLVGRWITPYWAEGHWVTDISPLMGLLANGGHRRFAFYTQQRYQVDLTLRLIDRGSGSTPRAALDLGLNGGAFNQDYNKQFAPIKFRVPEWAAKVDVASYITGHGWGTEKENCAEFCNHTHHFSVNSGPEHVKEHPDVDTSAPLERQLLGCAEQVPQGVVPNQGGTWIYARGGWCPGLDVSPWVVDVTEEITPTETNVLTYRGLFHGEDYVPEPADPPSDQGFNANIQMRSYMVFYATQTRRVYLPATQLNHAP